MISRVLIWFRKQQEAYEFYRRAEIEKATARDMQIMGYVFCEPCNRYYHLSEQHQCEENDMDKTKFGWATKAAEKIVETHTRPHPTMDGRKAVHCNDPRLMVREIADALANAAIEPVDEKNQVDREVLFFASYCEPENKECTPRRPCPTCLGMSNVFRVKGTMEYVRELAPDWLHEGPPRHSDELYHKDLERAEYLGAQKLIEQLKDGKPDVVESLFVGLFGPDSKNNTQAYIDPDRGNARAKVTKALNRLGRHLTRKTIKHYLKDRASVETDRKDQAKAIADARAEGYDEGANDTLSLVRKVNKHLDQIALTAIRSAKNWFQEYADRHTQKGDNEKAARNQDRANFLQQVFDQLVTNQATSLVKIGDEDWTISGSFRHGKSYILAQLENPTRELISRIAFLPLPEPTYDRDGNQVIGTKTVEVVCKCAAEYLSRSDAIPGSNLKVNGETLGSIPNDFANHPESVTERKAMKSGNAMHWTPRDALIEMLRRIDNKEVQADAVVIAVRENATKQDNCRTSFAMAGGDAHIALGLIERVKFMMQREG